MRLMSFDKKHEVGIVKIDTQHKDIIKTVNHIYEIKNHDKKEILESFDTLLGKLKNHFDSEETLMKENKVIHFISHKLEHDRALLKYSEYYNTYKSSDEKFNPEILVSLKNWLESHLVKKDKKLQDLVKYN